MFSLVVARDILGGIAKNGTIPWSVALAEKKIPNEDLQFFRELTSGGVVIMGRKTYESLPRNMRPLKNRINLVISKSCLIDGKLYNPNEATLQNVMQSATQNVMQSNKDNVFVFDDPWKCAKFAISLGAPVFVIGGRQIYEWFEQHGFIANFYISELNDDYQCDQLYIVKTTNFTQKIIKYINNPPGVIIQRTVHNLEEKELLNCMRCAYESQNLRKSRNGTTTSIFSKLLTFDLSNNRFPMLTTKRLNLRIIMEELLFFLRGQTDNKILQAKNVHVWDANTSQEFINKLGLPYREGDMGHTYGFSWRHFGADYKGCDVDYTGQGYDQLTNLVENLMKDPFGRRHVVSLWEPDKKHLAVLPPCLFAYQFYVRTGADANANYNVNDNDKINDNVNDNVNLILDCQAIQRSSDHFTAGGWNVASAALLTILLAHYCNMTPGNLNWIAGDIHIYENLREQVQVQLSGEPYLFPKLRVNRRPQFITEYSFEDLDLVGYVSHPTIKGVLNA